MNPTPTSSTPTTPIPVTILTGFLGCGKTTLLNRVLQEAHGQRIAVIENEFGQESVDHELLVQDRDEQIIEMNNGCICCTVRGDLVRILGELKTKRAQGTLQFDRVIIETTGLADPGPVAQTFFLDDVVADTYRLDAVITVVDAKHGPQQLDKNTEAQVQIAFADRILLSKTDLVTPADQDQLRQRIRKINPRAPIQAVHFGQVPLAEVLDLNGFNLNAVLEIAPDFLGNTSHQHDDAVSACVFESQQPFDPDRLEAFLGTITQAWGENLLRYKGILNLQGVERKVLFQGVHMLMGTDVGRNWLPGEPRSSKMVFIGRDLPKSTLLAGLNQCLLPALA